MKLWKRLRSTRNAPRGQVGGQANSPTSSNDSAATAVELPLELVELIIDNLHDDRTALAQCCIVSKSWLPRSRAGILSYPVLITREKAEGLYVLFLSPYNTLSRSSFSFSISIPEERRWPYLFLKNLMRWKLVIREIHISMCVSRLLEFIPMLETTIISASVQTLHLKVYWDDGIYVYEEPPVLWPVASGAISSLIINCSRTLSKLRLEGFCDHTSTGSPWPGITGRRQHPSPWRIDSLRLDTFPVDHFFPTLFDSSCNFAAISDLHIEIASYDGLRTQNIQKFLAFSEFDGLKTLSLGVVSVDDRDEGSWKNGELIRWVCFSSIPSYLLM